jgi:DNA-binding protein Alba
MEMSEESIIYIGQKPPMRYVTAVITAFSRGDIESVTLKARGRAISRAVDVAEITRNRFMEQLSSPIIEIDTEQMPNDDGGTRGVSTMAITLNKINATGKPPTPKAEAETEAESGLSTPSLTLTDIKGVGATTEEKLKDAGYNTVESLASTEPEAISEKTGISPKITEKLVKASKKLVD